MGTLLVAMGTCPVLTLFDSYVTESAHRKLSTLLIREDFLFSSDFISLQDVQIPPQHTV